MKININAIDRNQFNIKEGAIAGDKCFLINPSLSGPDWNKNNLHFRSLIINEVGDIVSCGYKKFFNALEKPDIDPWNRSWPCESTEKKDGSLLIVSKYKGELIIRTRGTFDARKLNNGYEIEFLKEKYPSMFNAANLSESISYLLEWVTPTNRIVLETGAEPELTLIGGIYHYNLAYCNSEYLDAFSILNGPPRPKKYFHNSFQECLEDVKYWKGKEGVVLSCPDNQTLRKVKGDEYLKAHYFLTQLNYNGILELIEQNNWPYKDNFYDIVEKTCDFEILQFVKGKIDKVYDVYSDILDQCELVLKFVNKLSGERKDISKEICYKYKDWRRGYSFLALDERPFKDGFLKKLIKEKLVDK